ncbi:MAG: type II toxin-antitoxin system HigB family toxin [Thermomicrobiales bacterium]|nr:type II toxin-antitoxin system HigB family toxin [Thermomicrobiales bacterium]
MHVITRRRLREFAAVHADATTALNTWFRVVNKAEWRTFAELRMTYRSADMVGQYTVFNVKDDIRIIAVVDFQWSKVFIKHVLTHAEYDRGRWK